MTGNLACRQADSNIRQHLQVLKAALGMVAPDVEIDDGKGLWSCMQTLQCFPQQYLLFNACLIYVINFLKSVFDNVRPKMACLLIILPSCELSSWSSCSKSRVHMMTSVSSAGFLLSFLTLSILRRGWRQNWDVAYGRTEVSIFIIFCIPLCTVSRHN